MKGRRERKRVHDGKGEIGKGEKVKTRGWGGGGGGLNRREKKKKSEEEVKGLNVRREKREGRKSEGEVKEKGQ